MQDTQAPDTRARQSEDNPEAIRLERAVWYKGMSMGIILCAAGTLLPLAFLLDGLHLVLSPDFGNLEVELSGLTLQVWRLQQFIHLTTLQILISGLGCLGVYLTGKCLRSGEIPFFLAFLIAGAQTILTLLVLAGVLLPILSLQTAGEGGV